MKGREEMLVPRELERLFQELEDGLISPKDRDTLGGLLRSDPGVRDAYFEHMLFAAALHSEAADRHDLSEEDAWPVKPRSATSLVSLSVFAAAAVIALVGVVLSLFAVKPPPRATVEASGGAEWTFEAGGIADKRDFTKDSRLVLERGVVRLEFSSGTVAYLAAPSTLVVRNRKEVELLEGYAWFEVAKGDEGFAVMTETLRAVDLGTEFGVESRREGDEVHVGRGRVRVESRLPREKPIEIKGGEAVASNVVGRLKRIPFRGGKFQKDLQTPKRIVHWSFDGEDPLAAQTNFGESPRISVEALRGTAETVFSDGRVGRALDLGAEGAYGVSDWMPPLGSTPRTVAFWFRKADGLPLDGRGYGWRHPPMVTWGNDREFLGKWQVTTDNDGAHIGTVWGGSWKVSHFPKGESIFDGGWHHLASIYTGKKSGESPEIILYLDGMRLPVSAEDDQGPVQTRPYPERWRQLTLGYYKFEGSRAGTLPMQIDELVIADFAFDDESVSRLARGESPEPVE